MEEGTTQQHKTTIYTEVEVESEITRELEK
jgi:hypothetical protein